VRIERLLDTPHQVERDGIDSLEKEPALEQSDAVLGGDCSAERQGSSQHFLFRGMGRFALPGRPVVEHAVPMPAWPKTGIASPERAEISPIRRSASGIAAGGTQTSWKRQFGAARMPC
jgi:hypothetical protein